MMANFPVFCHNENDKHLIRGTHYFREQTVTSITIEQ